MELLPGAKICLLRLLAVCWSLWNSRSTSGIEAIQCFCTSRDQPCQDPICEGSLCLVGFKNDVDLVQTCATEAARVLNKCARKLNEWQEVCSCQEDFCNTFSHMRERLRDYDQDPRAKKAVEGADTSNIVDEHAIARSTTKKNPKKQHLIILLVVIPLGVGALAVFLIFVNYHCKMC